MPGFLLHLGATLTCAHPIPPAPPGQAAPTVVNPRVLVSGQPITTLASPYAVVGCPLPSTGTPGCLTAQFVTSATRVTAGGQPVLLSDSQSICTPTGTALFVIATQTRVTGI
jgi:hypothetical protein